MKQKKPPDWLSIAPGSPKDNAGNGTTPLKKMSLRELKQECDAIERQTPPTDKIAIQMWVEAHKMFMGEISRRENSFFARLQRKMRFFRIRRKP